METQSNTIQAVSQMHTYNSAQLQSISLQGQDICVS